jgi:TonB family protein
MRRASARHGIRTRGGGRLHLPQREKKGSKTPLIGGLAAVLLIAAAGGAYFLKGRGAPAPPPSTVPPPTTMSAEMTALAQKAKDLEEKLQALEAEKAAASAKAEEDAKKKIEAQAKARGQAVDPRPSPGPRTTRARRRRRSRIARPRPSASAWRTSRSSPRPSSRRSSAARKRRARPRRRRPPTHRWPPPHRRLRPPPWPSGRALSVDVNDAGVIAPVALNKPSFTYPPIALRQRIEGKVDLSVLVDERGGVTDAKVISGAGGRAGLNEAASDYVKRWKFRPATKEACRQDVDARQRRLFMLPRYPACLPESTAPAGRGACG